MISEHGWEYRMVAAESASWWKTEINLEAFNRHLNALGKDGWEVVSVVGVQKTHGETKELVATLKRPRR